jgi:Na+-driven multidrug efflux pump
MRWILIAAPFMTASMTQNNQLRFLASARWGMFGMVAGAVLTSGSTAVYLRLSLGHVGRGPLDLHQQITGF